MTKKVKSKLSIQADLDRQEHIKKLVIIALFSDDNLMSRFVLKGGNAMDIVYNVSSRASVDVDVSMEGDFEPGRLEEIRERLERCLQVTFRPEGYEPFDVTLEPRPEHPAPEHSMFWGGYRMEFKLFEVARLSELSKDRSAMQRNAIVVGTKGKIQVDISKFEFTAGKTQREIDGFTVYVYTPEMLVAEKLRAICQQMPEYTTAAGGPPSVARSQHGSEGRGERAGTLPIVRRSGIVWVARPEALRRAWPNPPWLAVQALDHQSIRGGRVALSWVARPEALRRAWPDRRGLPYKRLTINSRRDGFSIRLKIVSSRGVATPVASMLRACHRDRRALPPSAPAGPRSVATGEVEPAGCHA